MLLFHGDKDERARMIEQDMVPGGFDVVVTSYEMVVREAGAFRKFAWRYLIVDGCCVTRCMDPVQIGRHEWEGGESEPPLCGSSERG